jgi:hypothetical protein
MKGSEKKLKKKRILFHFSRQNAIVGRERRR